MSAPTPAGDGESPTPGYYPDPSIPHYIRYWNGAAWVPGSSRPAPKAGESTPPLPGRGGRGQQRQPAAGRGHRAPEPSAAAGPGRIEETGPVFLDEEPPDRPDPLGPLDGRDGAGGPERHEPATAWRADASRQTGFGGEHDRRVSWNGSPHNAGRTPFPGPVDGPPPDGPGSTAGPGGSRGADGPGGTGGHADHGNPGGLSGLGALEASGGPHGAGAGQGGSVTSGGPPPYGAHDGYGANAVHDGYGASAVDGGHGARPADGEHGGYSAHSPHGSPAPQGRRTVQDSRALQDRPGPGGAAGHGNTSADRPREGSPPMAAGPPGADPFRVLRPPSTTAGRPRETAPRLPAQSGGESAVRPVGTTAVGDGPRPEGTLPIRPLRPRTGAEPPTDSTLTIRALRRARAQREQERAEAASRAAREGQAERERTERPRAEHAPADRLPADPPPGDAPPADRHPADRPPPLAPGLAPAGPLSPVPAVRSPAPVAPTRPQLRRPPAVDEAGEAVASWSQQVHRLARGGEPEQPPAEEPFARAARERARVRPAGLGRRFTARLVDSALLGALVAAVAVPVGLRTLQHVDHKIEAARHSGRTVTVWLVDGTTGAHLAVVLGALLIFGFVYEVLPTAWWGRTVGKQLCGVTVLDMGSQRLPSFGASLRRWLTHTLLGLIAIGALGVLWALFDHPWRQCWHDKAARTFVAVRRPSPRGA